MNWINSVMPNLKDFLTGSLTDAANQGLVGNDAVRGLVGGLIGKAGLGALYPGRATPPRNPENNLVFGARELSEMDIRQELSEQSNLAASSISTNLNEGKGITKNYDWRARLRPKAAGARAIYGLSDLASSRSILEPLAETGGLVWQYTPQIFMSGMANYNSAELHGTNYPINTFINSTPPTFPVTGDFTANTIAEARYLMAVIHFLKCVTKAHFGDASVRSGAFGTPPPVLLFEYMGENGFKKVPVVVRTYSIQYPDNVDYVPVKGGSSEDDVTFVPTVANITVDLLVNHTPHKIRKKFSIDSLRTGAGIKDGFV